MQRGGTQAAELIFIILLIAVIGFAALARKIRVPYPIVLVLGGLAVGFVPGLPPVALDPDVIFYVVLPPLLYAAAWQTSWREFSYNLVSISGLAVGLVGFTVAGVALGARFILPGLDWRTGFVLGAVVSTTDAIAATSIVRRMGLPRLQVGVSQIPERDAGARVGAGEARLILAREESGKQCDGRERHRQSADADPHSLEDSGELAAAGASRGDLNFAGIAGRELHSAGTARRRAPPAPARARRRTGLGVDGPAAAESSSMAARTSSASTSTSASAS